MKTIKIIFASLLILSGFQVNAQTVFTHNSNSKNTNQHITTIDNSATNGNANKLLFVTQVYNGKYNNHPFGVWYSAGKWTIYQEDKVKLEPSSYNVLAVDASDKAFMHKAEKGNISNNWTTINHPSCNNNPNAVLLVTQNWKGTYNPKSIGVWYSAGKWTIYNQDRSAMPVGTNFNVLVLPKGNTKISGGEASIFTANAAAKKNNYGKHLANLPLTKNSAKIFVTQNFGSRGPYNTHEAAVWFDGKNWTVYNKDKTELPVNTQFNILAIGASEIETAITELKRDVLEENSIYRLTNSFLKDERSLDVKKASEESFMGTTGNHNGQQWYFKSLGGDKYSIYDAYGRVLDVAEGNNKPFLSTWGNYTGQFWTITKQSNGYYRITDAYGRALDTTSGKKNEVVVVKVGNYTGQFWKLSKTGVKKN